MTRPNLRWIPWTVCFLVLVLGTSGIRAQQPEQQAGLVIVGEDGSVKTTCITFGEPQLTGLLLLERSGAVLDLRSGWGGTAVCGIDGLGCPPTDCFCQCKTAPCRYWSYFQRDGDGNWRYSSQGVHARSIAGGDVDAWVWGDGSAAPPSVSIDEICAPTEPLTPTVVTVSPPSATLPALSGETLDLPMPEGPVDSMDTLGYVVFVIILFLLVGVVVFRRVRKH